MTGTSPADRAKEAAAARALDWVEDGMRLGLGTGSTAERFVRLLGARVREEGLRLTCVATSSGTERRARAEGLRVTDLDSAGRLDLTVDGADEVAPDLSLVKGGGGALLQEKIVAAASERMLVIADAGKAVGHLGAFPLPVEVVRFGWRTTMIAVGEVLEEEDVLGRDAALRPGEEGPFVTDEGHHILDLSLRRIGDPRRLGLVLSQVPGVVEHGLFTDLADAAVLGLPDGGVEIRDGPSGKVRVEAGADPGDDLFGDLPG